MYKQSQFGVQGGMTGTRVVLTMATPRSIPECAIHTVQAHEAEPQNVEKTEGDALVFSWKTSGQPAGRGTAVAFSDTLVGVNRDQLREAWQFSAQKTAQNHHRRNEQPAFETAIVRTYTHTHTHTHS